MAEIQSALRNILIADVSISAIVGTRIYFERSPDNPSFPFILFEQVSMQPENGLNSFSEVWFSEFNFISYVARDTQSTTGEALRKAIFNALNQKIGVYSDVRIGACLLLDESISWLEADQVWAVEQTFTVNFNHPS